MLTEPILDGRAWTRQTVGEEPSWTAQLPAGWLDSASDLLPGHEKDPGRSVTALPVPPGDGCGDWQTLRATLDRGRGFFEVGYRKAGLPLSQRQLRALEVLQELLRLPELRVEFRLRPGQVLLTNNHWILHNRTGFEDSPIPQERRHFVRLWLSNGCLRSFSI